MKIGLLAFVSLSNLLPIVYGSLCLSQGGDRWGGKLPFMVNLSLGLMVASGIAGSIVGFRLLYQLSLSKSYRGSKSGIH